MSRIRRIKLLNRCCAGIAAISLGFVGYVEAGQLTMTKDAKAYLVKAENMPLAEVLDQLSKASDMAIHRVIPAEKTITAHCYEPTLPGLIKCLFKGEASQVTRYRNNHPQQTEPVEIWVISELEDSSAVDSFPVTSHELVAANDSELTEWLTEPNAAFRADNVARLSDEARGKTPLSVDALLQSALQDQSAEVRAQAVAALAKNEGYDKTAVLQSALLDSDASVRLMAVDQAGSQPELLQQALADNDPTVRAYAAQKLQALHIDQN